MNSFLKPFRVAVSLVFLLAVSFVLLDFRHVLPSGWVNVITYLQFVPSVIKFIGWTGIFSVGFIIVIVITLLYGRIYCSTICPLGILQDFFSFLSKKFRGRKMKFKYAKSLPILRYSFLALAILPLFFGALTALSLLDPYSNFGRIMSDLGRPVYNYLNNVLADVLMNFQIYVVSPVELPHGNFVQYIFAFLVFIVIIWLSITKGRLYCNTVCPVGTLLGFLSKYALFQLKIDQDSCVQCGKCAFVCKSQCIDIKSQKIDPTRCVACFNCFQSCDKKSIRYQFAYNPVRKESRPEVAPTDESKRNFIVNSFLLTSAFIGISKISNAKEPAGKKGKALIPVVRKSFSSPPGSKSIVHFNNACTACHLCVSACTNGVLQPSFLEYGLVGFLQPFMDYKKAFCNFDCNKCGKVCPTGAIMPLTHEQKKTCQIGVVKFIEKNCIVYTNETSCGSCSEHCPTQAVKMVPYKGKLSIPEVKEDICVGCGACEHACPALPNKAIYVEGNPVQKVSKKPEIKKLEVKKLEDFPF